MSSPFHRARTESVLAPVIRLWLRGRVTLHGPVAGISGGIGDRPRQGTEAVDHWTLWRRETMKTKRSLPWWFCWMAFSVCGCSTYKVEIRSDPAEANVEITRKAGSELTQPFRLPHATPVTYKFDFANSATFDLKATKDGFLDFTQQLTENFVANLPFEAELRVLRLTLKEAPYTDIEKAEIVIDPREGLTVRLRRVRAYQEDIERQGTPASNVVRLGEGLGLVGLAISPDGRQIVFSVVERAQDENNRVVQFSNLRAVNSNGGGISQITTGRWMDIDPCLSLDGKYIYFASSRLRNGGMDLFRIKSLSKEGGIGVVYRQGDGWSRSPSEGGGGLLAFGFQPNYSGRVGTSHVWTLGGVSQYPTQMKEGVTPKLSPAGDRIAYIGPDHKLWVVDVTTQASVQMTTNPETKESEPTWFPDGSCLVYVSDEGKDGTGQSNNDIWIMKADGTDRRQLTTNGSDDITPVVDPDQKWIYFVSNRGFRWGIWRIPISLGEMQTEQPQQPPPRQQPPQQPHALPQQPSQ